MYPFSDNCWTFAARTDNSGNFRAQLLQAPAGSYQAEITVLTHDVDLWDNFLDVDNPDVYAKQ